jgi:multidrug efflux pump subunit AcrA (membrane-fusion protein)
MLVKIEPASAKMLDESSRYVATFKSRKSVNLKPQVPGRILDIGAISGDKVAKGAALIKLDQQKQEALTANSEAAIESAIADTASAEANLKSLTATRLSRLSNVKFGKAQFARYQQLNKEGAVSTESVDDYRNRLSVAEAEVEAIDAQIKAQEAIVARSGKQVSQARAALREQQEQQRYFTVRAPFSGIVGDIPVKVGDYVDPNTVLTTVDEDFPLELYIAVPMTQAKNLKFGQAAQVIDDGGQVVDEGKIFFISPQVDQKDQSVLAKAVFGNQSHKFRSGQIVNARVVWDKVSAITIPVAAVSRMSGQDFVFVAENDAKGATHAKQKVVRLGEIQGNEYRVLSGVESGERVITSGTQNLADGVPVKPQS